MSAADEARPMYSLQSPVRKLNTVETDRKQTAFSSSNVAAVLRRLTRARPISQAVLKPARFPAPIGAVAVEIGAVAALNA